MSLSDSPAAATVSEKPDSPAAPEIPTAKSPRAKKPPLLDRRKHLTKKQKIALFAAGWVLLLGLGAGIAFLIQPAPEVVHTNAIIEAYKFAASAQDEITDTVDDLDYYGTYTPNALSFTEITTGKTKGASTISGLKNKSVEEKVNSRIQSVASALYDLYPERDGVSMTVTANYFNILSLKLSQYNYNETHDEYLTFDLNTGDELTFDNLFSPNVDLASLLYKSFYDSLSTDLQFDRLAAEKRLKAESYAPNPAACYAQYCPLPGETYASLRALITDYDSQMANMEQTAANTVRNYLAGEKRFYLNSYGPAFVLADGRAMKMELKDDLRYAVYLKRYRSADSLFDGTVALTSNPFYTELPVQPFNFINEETATYLFDYYETVNSETSPEIRRALRDYVKNKGLSASGTPGKFRHLLADGTASQWGNIRTGYLTVCAYETDKSYYDSTYRRAIIDGKTQSVMMSGQQPARSGHYDPNRVSQITLDFDGLRLEGNECYTQIHVAITGSGKVLDRVGEILVNPASGSGWEDYLKTYAYDEKCHSSYEPVCYTDAEKQSHELFYVFGGSYISIRRKVPSAPGWEQLGSVDLNALPAQYLNPAILAR